MGSGRFSDEFKRDAVVQITERGYSVSEVSQRSGVSTHLLYAWRKQYGSAARADDRKDKAGEIRRLKRELLRVSEERDILKKPPRISPEMQSGIRVRFRLSLRNAQGNLFGRAVDIWHKIPSQPDRSDVRCQYHD